MTVGLVIAQPPEVLRGAALKSILPVRHPMVLRATYSDSTFSTSRTLRDTAAVARSGWWQSRWAGCHFLHWMRSGVGSLKLCREYC